MAGELRNVAVFWDFENVDGCTGDGRVDVAAVMGWINRQGRVIANHAVGDFSYGARLDRYKASLQQHGIQLQQTTARSKHRTEGRKGLADIALTIALVETVLTHTVDEVIIVSGDVDFVELARWCKRHCHVTAIAVGTPNLAWQEAPDRFVRYSEILRTERPTAPVRPNAPSDGRAGGTSGTGGGAQRKPTPPPRAGGKPAATTPARSQPNAPPTVPAPVPIPTPTFRELTQARVELVELARVVEALDRFGSSPRAKADVENWLSSVARPSRPGALRNFLESSGLLNRDGDIVVVATTEPVSAWRILLAAAIRADVLEGDGPAALQRATAGGAPFGDAFAAAVRMTAEGSSTPLELLDGVPTRFPPDTWLVPTPVASPEHRAARKLDGPRRWLAGARSVDRLAAALADAGRADADLHGGHDVGAHDAWLPAAVAERLGVAIDSSELAQVRTWLRSAGYIGRAAPGAPLSSDSEVHRRSLCAAIAEKVDGPGPPITLELVARVLPALGDDDLDVIDAARRRPASVAVEACDDIVAVPVGPSSLPPPTGPVTASWPPPAPRPDDEGDVALSA